MVRIAAQGFRLDGWLGSVFPRPYSFPINLGVRIFRWFFASGKLWDHDKNLMFCSLDVLLGRSHIKGSSTFSVFPEPFAVSFLVFVSSQNGFQIEYEAHGKRSRTQVAFWHVGKTSRSLAFLVELWANRNFLAFFRFTLENPFFRPISALTFELSFDPASTL